MSSQITDYLDETNKYVRVTSQANQPPIAVSGTVTAVISGGSIKTDRSGYTEGTSTFTPIGGVFNDTLGQDLTEDTNGVARMTARRALHMSQRDSTGVEVGVNTAVSLFSTALVGAGITSGSTITNAGGRTALFTLTVSAASGTNPTLAVQIQGQNADGVWFNLPGVAFAEQTAAGSPLTLFVAVGAAASANVSVNFRVPRSYRAVYSIGGTGTPSFTFTLDADYGA
jgi:hypothetical protein